MTLEVGLAALFAGLLCAVAHWTGEMLSHGRLSRLWRYAIGVGTIGLAFGAWCWEAGHAEAFAAWLVIAVGAGVGTAAAYVVDHVAGVQREVRLLDGESKARRTGVRGE